MTTAQSWGKLWVSQTLNFLFSCHFLSHLCSEEIWFCQNPAKRHPVGLPVHCLLLVSRILLVYWGVWGLAEHRRPCQENIVQACFLAANCSTWLKLTTIVWDERTHLLARHWWGWGGCDFKQIESQSLTPRQITWLSKQLLLSSRHVIANNLLISLFLICLISCKSNAKTRQGKNHGIATSSHRSKQNFPPSSKSYSGWWGKVRKNKLIWGEYSTVIEITYLLTGDKVKTWGPCKTFYGPNQTICGPYPTIWVCLSLSKGSMVISVCLSAESTLRC